MRCKKTINGEPKHGLWLSLALSPSLSRRQSDSRKMVPLGKQDFQSVKISSCQAFLLKRTLLHSYVTLCGAGSFATVARPSSIRTTPRPGTNQSHVKPVRHAQVFPQPLLSSTGCKLVQRDSKCPHQESNLGCRGHNATS